METMVVDSLNLKISIEYVDMLNYALTQNDYPLIKNLSFYNEDEEEIISNIKLRVISNSKFIYNYEQLIPEISAQKNIIIENLDIQYNYELFKNINENTKTHFFVEILDESNNVIFSKGFKVNILPYEHWLGTNVYPQLTSSYIVPNDLEVKRIVAEAGKKLKDWTNDPSFYSYQTNRFEDVRIQAAAIYATLQKENISYKYPPASFEKFGQKIRYPQEIIQFKNGTCLDLTFLYVACLEAVGINPIVIFTRGHAFTGFWLKEKNLTESYTLDYADISKRLSKGTKELEIVETTALVSGKDYSFEQAVNLAHQNLDNPYNFECIVDVIGCRNIGIKPISTSNEKLNFKMEYGERTGITTIPSKTIEKIDAIDYKVNQLEKTDIWSRNLLDLTLRNSLINFRVNTNSLQLMIYDLATLEDELASSKNFTIIAKPENLVTSNNDLSFYNVNSIKKTYEKLIDADFKDNKIRSFLTAYMLNKRLKNLYRKAKIDLEENGSSSLFLAMGFLSWNNGENSDRNYYAPLILLPLSIERKSASSSIQLELSDEEPQFNVTLVEYLKQKFNIDLRHLVEMPRDGKGVDIPRLFVSIRQAIMNKKGWDIEEIAVISNFSFKKFVMWNDLQARQEEIVSNSNVEALISGNYKQSRAIENIEARSIESEIMPHDLKTGSLVDASQLEAIKASEKSSFVLHGPPGTGKSQTITNMIIHNLNKGKKILFVAEKRAALDVVKDRLEKLNFEEYLLALHSNTTRKNLFLNKIEKSLSNKHEQVTVNIHDKSKQLFNLKNRLSNYVEELHKKQPSGFSIYELIQEYEKYDKFSSLIEIPDKIVKELTIRDIDIIKDNCQIVDESTKNLSFSYDNHPLKSFNISKYSISKRNKFEDIINGLSNDIDKLVFTLSEYIKTIDFNNKTLGDLLDYYKIIKIINMYQGSTAINDKILMNDSEVPLKSAFNFAKSTLDTYRNNKSFIESKYETNILDIEAQYLLSEYKEIKSTNGFFKKRKIKQLIDLLSSKTKNNISLEEEEFIKDLNRVIDFQKSREILQKRNDDFIDSFGSAWKGKITDLEELKYQIDFVEQNQININDIKNIHELIERKVSQPNNYEKLAQVYNSLNDNFNCLVTDYNASSKELKSINIKDINHAVAEWSKSIVDLKSWCLINDKINNLEKTLQTSIRKTFMESQNHISLYQQIFKKLVEKLIKYYFISNESLDEFNGFEINESIKLLKEKVEDFNQLSIHETKEIMNLNVAKKKESNAYEDEFLILQKAIRSKGRGQSIRTIFNRTSNIIQDLFPVMLMSPLSIAQYIDPHFPKFDLIIFDEASQISTDIAIGAISRAKNCIIVGDPKQMPPTKFFGANNIDEDNYELEDLESLLDDCLAANFPEKHLKWHYRSKHESLIHFSNRTYYNSALLTYPSPDALSSKVNLKNVQGIYQRGNGRINEEEANYIVNKLIEHLKSNNNDSIGVITFNTQQQALIENLFEENLIKYKELDTKNSNLKESVFIKNLENVQGDERDIILFSTTFGYDENNKMTMNFGPLNNNGGWRRLNVAITRARKEMTLVTSFNPEDIDLNRTSAEGVKGLKGFMEYARNSNSLPPVNKNLNDEKNSIAVTLQSKLKEQGYECQINLGNSEFKIDLAVLNPKDENEFLLAILIDGKNYYNAQTSVDRNIIQPNVMKSLRWNVNYIWSIDWYENKDREINKILKILDELKEK
ncbi:DUF4011 domain-containing protein [Staphylococcus haemolyticus]|uniref:DUF4011 domain-containing protein n=1 Tax=Staphylococcus haemolyticus TaxID=1283 RepID=UPI002883CD0C|nr:DUF4011 domain-containing protein [Staphylococcus haemolyticus]MDT0738563.1 DUF4011 domain-containing protein [Staphylococcus haemolyticus]